MYGWQGRFDDPKRRYRTLSCTKERRTCLSEALADLRPQTEMLAEWGRLYEGEGVEDMRVAGRVTGAWREGVALAEATIAARSELANLEDVELRGVLESRHAALLADHGPLEIGLARLRSITQTISRSLYEDGYAGIRFRSHLDGGACFVLFEGRAWLEPTGREPEPVAGDVPELLQAASDLELILKRG